MNFALLLAGDAGLRFPSDIPEQYIRMNDKMLITYALEALVNSPFIDSVHIVAEHEWREFIVADCEKYEIKTNKIKDFSVSGFNRQASILNGLQNILREKNGKADINNIEEDDNVLIHDAVRPLVAEQINTCFEKLSDGYDGALSVFPPKDSAYLDDNNIISEVIDNEMFTGQTLGLFKLKKYYQANMALMPDKLKDIKSSAEPAVLAGMNLAVIWGDKGGGKNV